MVVVSCVVALPACTQKSKVSYNVSQDANNFNDVLEKLADLIDPDGEDDD
jgi:hypothetical protein